MPLPLSCLSIQMDILSNNYLALIYNYYITGDYVAIYQCPGCITGLCRCTYTHKYNWLNLCTRFYTAISHRDFYKLLHIGLFLSVAFLRALYAFPLVNDWVGGKWLGFIHGFFFVLNFKSNLPLKICSLILVWWICATLTLSLLFPFCYISVLGTFMLKYCIKHL